jgi:hypothetical protein
MENNGTFNYETSNSIFIKLVYFVCNKNVCVIFLKLNHCSKDKLVLSKKFPVCESRAKNEYALGLIKWKAECFSRPPCTQTEGVIRPTSLASHSDCQTPL